MAGQSSQDRYAAGVERVYANERIEVTWEPGRCIHYAACIRGSVRAFNPQRRPWVDVNAETPERIAEIIERCPTGALHAIWKDGHTAEDPPTPATVVPTVDGPLFLHGQFRILDRAGNLVREDTRIALCRCGHSKHKPFCDDSHYTAGFTSDDPEFGPEPEDPDVLIEFR